MTEIVISENNDNDGWSLGLCGIQPQCAGIFPIFSFLWQDTINLVVVNWIKQVTNTHHILV